tara:strand:- start:883 stop:1008 length:126 start_codon:yes stop_codon:yes gene_type:complete
MTKWHSNDSLKLRKKGIRKPEPEPSIYDKDKINKENGDKNK